MPRDRIGQATSAITGPIRISVDIGGTFTDLQILDEQTGRHHAFKTSTTPDDPSLGLITGIEQAARKLDFGLDQVTSLMHGTTIATNAVLENTLSRGALVTTAGFRDVLEIGRHVRRDVYAAVAAPRRLLVARADRYDVPERINAAGEVLEPLNEDAAHSVAKRIAQSDAEVVAVCLLHAYANADHERRVGEILREVLGHDRISLSHAVSPEIREFERTSTTVLNALLIPVVNDYLDRLRARMTEHAFSPSLFLVQSNGGVTSPQTAAEQPVKLLLSGPSGGALATKVLGKRVGEANLVAIDMGGTSFDVSIVQDGKTRLITEGSVDGCPVRLPMVEIRTIGAGGGSISRCDATGRLRVGPESAGAVPGPVAYQRGGELPTVTDANVALGRLDAKYFLGGAVSLDPESATTAIREQIAEPLRLSGPEAAEGVLRVAVANMAAAIRLSLFEKGLDPKDFALVSFGGAAGLHAAHVATQLGAARIIYPRDAGTLSAWGMLFADVTHDLAKSRLLAAEAEALPALRTMIRELMHEGQQRLNVDRIPTENRSFVLSLDMRYPGQAYELVVPVDSIDGVDGNDLDESMLKAAVQYFHQLHLTRYAHAEPQSPVEIVSLRLAAVGRLKKPELAVHDTTAGTQANLERRVYLDGRWLDLSVYERDEFAGGACVNGPAVIESQHATILLPAGWTLRCMPSGDLCANLSREETT